MLPVLINQFDKPGLSITGKVPVFFVIISLFLVNLIYGSIPFTKPASNPKLNETVALSDYVNQDTTIIYPWTDEGHTLSLYVQYYLECDALTINKLIEIGHLTKGEEKNSGKPSDLSKAETSENLLAPSEE